MTSPAKQHFMRETALVNAQESAADPERLTPYRRLLVSLHQDKAALKNIQSIQDKAKAKAAMLPAYAEWVQGVMAADNPSADDEVLGTVIVWMVDTGALDAAVPMVRFAVRHRLESADEYQRTLPTLLYEQIGEQITAGHSITQAALETLLADALAKNDNGSHAVDMPDPVRAKFLKAAGIWHSRHGSADRAADLLEKAIAYDDRVGAKQLLKELRAKLRG